ncbi:MAG: thioesterase [Phycisphaeraceae bacterium]|nr:MAG: thioesterase [Phycisphaeraceae bacterium]
MPTFEPKTPDYAQRVRASFAKQTALTSIGAELAAIEPGEVRISLPRSERVLQQHGFVHAGIITAIVDSACGYAALTLMPEGTGVLSVEFKVNLLAPARGETFVAIGRVVRPGRTITICTGTVEADDGGRVREVALMQATMMGLADKPGVAD